VGLWIYSFWQTSGLPQVYSVKRTCGRGNHHGKNVRRHLRRRTATSSLASDNDIMQFVEEEMIVGKTAEVVRS